MEQPLLIVNADDLGKTREATDAILEAYARGRITSTTAMVWAADSERSARLAILTGIPVGLHLNLTEAFTSPNVPHDVAARQRLIAGRMTASKYFRWLFWPDLARVVPCAIRDQLTEFCRLYGRPPTHVDGHHHIHTSANVLFSRAIPANLPMRSSYTFAPTEKGVANRALRRAVNAFIRTRHPTTRLFLSIDDFVERPNEADFKLGRSRDCSVEVMCHPGVTSDWAVLMSESWRDVMRSHRRLGDFRCLNRDGP